MALPLYLAMTAAELFGAPSLPSRCAYMACHFSPYGTGLSNFPQHLPEGAMLILNDRTPVQGHDPALIAAQLTQCAEEWNAAAILLDFQRPGCPQTAQIARAILASTPCPTAISACYGQEIDCPVFLSPLPPDRRLEDHIAPWKGRELWLEAALEGQCMALTSQGSSVTAHFSEPSIVYPFADPQLHCHYRIETGPNQVRFLLQRTPADLDALLQEAEMLGITWAIGLYQELGPVFSAPTESLPSQP